jgi:hypothetical protein
MKTLFLHIGTPKTGTTALQWFFFQNRTLLKEYGITYPEFGLVDDCHHRIGSSFHQPEYRPYYIQYNDMLTLEEYAEMIKAIDGNVLISTELISHGHLASNLRRAIGDIDIRVVVYLRRQDSLLESWYNQEVKLLSGEDIHSFTPVQEVYWTIGKEFSRDGPAEWGTEKIIVRVYEKASFAKHTICDDFVENVFGWERSEAFAMPPTTVNPGLSMDALLYKRAVNNLPLSDEVKCLLSTTMVNYSLAADSGETNAASLSIIEGNFRKQLLEQYEESNAWIARTFFGRKDGCLFAEPNWEADDESERGLSKEKIVAISQHIAHEVPALYQELCAGVVEGIRAKDNSVRAASELLSVGIS